MDSPNRQDSQLCGLSIWIKNQLFLFLWRRIQHWGFLRQNFERFGSNSGINNHRYPNEVRANNLSASCRLFVQILEGN